jgi:hypothetical protein
MWDLTRDPPIAPYCRMRPMLPSDQRPLDPVHGTGMARVNREEPVLALDAEATEGRRETWPVRGGAR